MPSLHAPNVVQPLSGCNSTSSSVQNLARRNSVGMLKSQMLNIIARTRIYLPRFKPPVSFSSGGEKFMWSAVVDFAWAIELPIRSSWRGDIVVAVAEIGEMCCIGITLDGVAVKEVTTWEPRNAIKTVATKGRERDVRRNMLALNVGQVARGGWGGDD